MKKLIYALFAVVLLAACNTNDNSGVVSKDQSMLKKVSKNALDQIGKQQTEVADALLKLGFKEMEAESPAPARLRQSMLERLRQPAHKDAKSAMRIFAYNFPTNIEDYKEEDIVAFLNKIVDSRKVCLEVYVEFDDSLNLVRAIESYCYVGRDVEGVNDLYRNFSDNVYASLGYVNASEPKFWGASLTDDGEYEHEYASNQRDTFWMDYEKVVYPLALEQGVDVRAKQYRYYFIQWDNNVEDVDIEGVKPLSAGTFYVYTY